MVTISLCMIVKDEEEVLGRCLDSVQEIVDEIVIVDTGSKDHTKEIASTYTNRILDFPWIDDFAAARNFSFSQATMDYCMWLDADDVISEEERKKLSAWKMQADGSTDAVMLKYVAGFDEQRKPTFVYYRERILKKESGFLWKGRVHEAIAVSGKVEYLEICVEHQSSKSSYGTRNLDIYEKMKAEGELTEARDWFYYARELYYHGKYRESLDCFLFFLSLRDAFVENQVEACRFASYCCYAIGEEKRALDFLLKGLKYRVPSGELCCDIGKHYFDRKLWENAIFWYNAALCALQKEQGGGFVQKECYGYIPYVQLSVCYDHMGEKKKARKCHKKAGKYKPYGKEYTKNKEYFHNL